MGLAVIAMNSKEDADFVRQAMTPLWAPLKGYCSTAKGYHKGYYNCLVLSREWGNGSPW